MLRIFGMLLDPENSCRGGVGRLLLTQSFFRPWNALLALPFFPLQFCWVEKLIAQRRKMTYMRSKHVVSEPGYVCCRRGLSVREASIEFNFATETNLPPRSHFP